MDGFELKTRARRRHRTTLAAIGTAALVLFLFTCERGPERLEPDSARVPRSKIGPSFAREEVAADGVGRLRICLQEPDGTPITLSLLHQTTYGAATVAEGPECSTFTVRTPTGLKVRPASRFFWESRRFFEVGPGDDLSEVLEVDHACTVEVGVRRLAAPASELALLFTAGGIAPDDARSPALTATTDGAGVATYVLPCGAGFRVWSAEGPTNTSLLPADEFVAERGMRLDLEFASERSFRLLVVDQDGTPRTGFQHRWFGTSAWRPLSPQGALLSVARGRPATVELGLPDGAGRRYVSIPPGQGRQGPEGDELVVVVPRAPPRSVRVRGALDTTKVECFNELERPQACGANGEVYTCGCEGTLARILPSGDMNLPYVFSLDESPQVDLPDAVRHCFLNRGGGPGVLGVDHLQTPRRLFVLSFVVPEGTSKCLTLPEGGRFVAQRGWDPELLEFTAEEGAETLLFPP